MSPDKHIISGIILGTGAYLITKDITLAGASCLSALSAFICDMDHVIEYGAYCIRHKVRPTIREFFSGEYFEKKGKICIIFHAYEYLALLIIAAIYSSDPVIVGAALGYALHLILDTIGNDCTFAGYCISYRIMRMDKEKREKSIFMDGDGRINVGFLSGSEFPREKTFLTFIIVSPIIIVLMALFKEMHKYYGKSFYKHSYFYYFIMLFSILPQYILNVDWGRWMLATNILIFTEIFYLAYKHDTGLMIALDKLTLFIYRHKFLTAMCVIYIAGLDKFYGRSFIEEADRIATLLIDSGVSVN